MKCLAQISALIVAMLLSAVELVHAQATSGTSSAPSQPTSMGQIPIPSTMQNPTSPSIGGPLTTGSSPGTAPGTVPTQTAPGTQTGSPTGATTSTAPRESDSWAMVGLKQEVATSIQRDASAAPKKKSTKPKKTKLSQAKVTELQNNIALGKGGAKGEMSARLKLAEHFDSVGDEDKVVETLRPALDKLQRKGLILLARGYRAQKNHLNEVRTLETLLALKENDYYAQYLLGNAYASLGRKDEALNKYEESRRINPHFLPPYEALLQEAKRIGRFHDSTQALEDMINNFGDKPHFNNELCMLYTFQAFLEKAFEICQKAITKDPKHAPNHVFLGLVARDKDGIDAGERILKKAAQQFQSSELAQWAAGEVSWEKRNYPAAFNYFNQAVKDDPSQGRSQIGLARSAFELQKYDIALAAFVEACQKNHSLLPDFRKSAAILRQKNNFQWIERYEAGLAKCGIY